MNRVLSTLALAVAFVQAAGAAQLNGIAVPDVVQAGSTTLRLNGIALRTYSIFRIPIYVAALYLEHLSSKGNEILESPENKLLELHFVHDVAADRVRSAWREDFRRYCSGPCFVPQQEIEQFLTEVPAMRNGDKASFAFTSYGADVSINGQLLGKIYDPQFARMVLGVFIGSTTALPALRRDLLGAQR